MIMANSTGGDYSRENQGIEFKCLGLAGFVVPASTQAIYALCSSLLKLVQHCLLSLTQSFKIHIIFVLSKNLANLKDITNDVCVCSCFPTTLNKLSD